MNQSDFINQYRGKFRGSADLTINNFYECLLKNPEIHHAYNCCCKIESSRAWKLHEEIGTDSKDGHDKETLIFENRQLPHMEYLIRSMVYRLKDDWNHTVICTDSNYNYIKLMCNLIHPGIRVLNVGSMEINQNSFNNMLLTVDFWEQINGEKILVYQQDADIYHNNIDEFLVWDWIGAPWPDDSDNNSLNVGNGGFNLRSKSKLIDCLNHIHPGDLPLYPGTRSYMDGKTYLGTPMDYPPEDVYYSKTMIDYKLGKVATKDISMKFSNETYNTSGALGGHQYWSADKSVLFDKINNCTLQDWGWVEGEAQYHISGWPGVINNAVEHGVVTRADKEGQILLIDNIEKYFIWENNKPINRPWIGITHCTPNTPPYLSVINTDTLLCNSNFLKSISTCKGLITLSKYMEQYLLKYLRKVEINFLKHPTAIDNVPQFDVHNFNTIVTRNDLSIVSLGQQLRYMSTIYRLNTDMKKIWLTGTSDLTKMRHLLQNECEWLDINIDTECVDMKYIKDKTEYIDTIYNNIVLIDLIDASANNAVLELTAGRVPFIIRKLPAIVEYIGHDYPLYFNDYNHLQEIISNKDRLFKLLEHATNYLSDVDLHTLSQDTFTGSLLRLINS